MRRARSMTAHGPGTGRDVGLQMGPAGTAKSGGKLLAWLPCADKVIALWFFPDSRELRIADASGATPAQRMISSSPFRPRIQCGSPLHARITRLFHLRVNWAGKR
jgi:hypothetical protein